MTLSPEQEAIAREAARVMSWGQGAEEMNFTVISDAIARAVELRSEDTTRQIKAAEKVCEIYFNIACEVYSENEVRRKRDEAIDATRKP